MTAPVGVAQTTFVQFTLDDGNLIWVRRDCVAFFIKDPKAPAFRTILYLDDGSALNVNHPSTDVVTMCTLS